MAETFTFGLDLSHHQGTFDFVRAKREGIQFVILKATEGSGFVDSRFAANLVAARRAGLLVAAYHYQRSNVGVEAQVSNVLRVVPRDVPVIPDVEANSGTVAMTRDLVATLRSNGFRVPLLYLPRWYWQQIGAPSLVGLPPLWSSRYPDNVVGSIRDEFADVPARFWEGYGGLPVKLLQFTSSAAVAGRSPIDANAFRGTRAQFAALLGGGTPPPVEDDMQLNDKFVDADVNEHPGTFGHKVLGTWQNARSATAKADTILGLLKELQTGLSDSEARIIGAMQAGTVDIDGLADGLIFKLGPDFAEQLVAAIGRALSTPNPTA